MNEELLVNIIGNFPNFLGFIALAYVLNNSNTRYLNIIEKLLEKCFSDDPDTQTWRDQLE